MFENYPSLLVTKLHIPRLRPASVSRQRLIDVLEAGSERRLVLIAAAAGFGKTTLVAEWSAQHAETTCWLSLDAADNDPARFLSYLVAAIQVRRPEIGQELLAVLQSPQPPPLDYAVRILINQLAAYPEPLSLVLDDYHVIDNESVHTALALLLDHLPPAMNIILLTRADPPLPLARLRARHELLELRAADLRFSEEETANFTGQIMGLDLPADAVRALDARTEGWIAGLQLATIAIQSAPGDKQAFIQSFTGSHRFILDYLIEEVLSRLPDAVRMFLLHTSILERLSGALCGAVAGGADGQAMLEYLDRNNLFLIPLDQDRRWYRYHHLFADLLRARLQAEDPDAVNELHTRAARWLSQNGFPEEAVAHALACRDYEYAADLITGPALNPIKRGEAATLIEWYKAFPANFVVGHPRLSLQVSLALALNGRWGEVESVLSQSAPLSDTDDIASLPPEALALAYMNARHRHNAARLAALASQAAADVHLDSTTKLVLALLVSADGDLRQACHMLVDVQQRCEQEGESSLALTALFHQCRFQVFLGNLRVARALSEQALQRCRDLGRAAIPMATFAHVSLGRIFIEWNEPEQAHFHLSEAIRLAESTGFVTGMLSSSTMMLAEVKQIQGDTEGALQEAQSAIACAERNDPPAEVHWLKFYQARILLTQGNSAATADLLGAAHSPSVDPQPASIFYPYTIRTITQARLLLAQRKPEEAASLLTELGTSPHDLLTVEALALLALARQAQGDSVHAMLALEQAVMLGEAENRVRAFLDLGYPMAKLLTRFAEAHPDARFAQTLLAALPPISDSAPPVEPLSEREIEVIRLIAAGYSNEEIARSLTIAMSTVKWYVNTLYAKLHVKTRSQAIARAHDLRLVKD